MTIDQLKVTLATELTSRNPVDTSTRLRSPVPRSADVLLGLVPDVVEAGDPTYAMVREYFLRTKTIPVTASPTTLLAHLYEEHLTPLTRAVIWHVQLGGESGTDVFGRRGVPDITSSGSTVSAFPAGASGSKPSFLSRLFLGDVVWLYFMERMGLFKMLGVLLDDYATRGRYPLSAGSDPAVVLEIMALEMKSGAASLVRDRDATYRRCLGWTSDVGAKLGKSSAIVNTEFNDYFHKFLKLALDYYKDKRLAVAIQGVGTPQTQQPPSAATVTAIKQALELLRQAMKRFEYGRSHTNTLNGILWAIGSLSLVRKLRQTIGVTVEDLPDLYVPAAYELLVNDRAGAAGDVNRYTANKGCADAGRSILMQAEVVSLADPLEDLKVWLDLIETAVESYRSNYLALTGIDLGAAGPVRVEQAAA